MRRPSLRRALSSTGVVSALALGIALLCGPACSTIGTINRGETWLYSGTRANIRPFLPARKDDYAVGLVQVFAICDFPFSLGLDTFFLPFTLPLQLIVGDKPEPPPRPPAAPKD